MKQLTCMIQLCTLILKKSLMTYKFTLDFFQHISIFFYSAKNSTLYYIEIIFIFYRTLYAFNNCAFTFFLFFSIFTKWNLTIYFNNFHVAVRRWPIKHSCTLSPLYQKRSGDNFLKNILSFLFRENFAITVHFWN